MLFGIVLSLVGQCDVTEATAIAGSAGIRVETQTAQRVSRAAWIAPNLMWATEAVLSDKTLIRPKQIEIGFGPKEYLTMTGIKWSGWGTTRAVGRGKLTLCTKICVNKGTKSLVLTEFFGDPCRGDETLFYKWFEVPGIQNERVPSMC